MDPVWIEEKPSIEEVLASSHEACDPRHRHHRDQGLGRANGIPHQRVLGEVDPSVVRGLVSKARGPKGLAGSIPALSAQGGVTE